jgi:hypothetical protein
MVLANTHFWEPFSISKMELAKHCGLTDCRTLATYISDLIGFGLVEVSEQNGMPSAYKITDLSAHQPPSKNVPPQKTTPLKKCSGSPAKNVPPPPSKNVGGSDFTPYSIKTEDYKDLYNVREVAFKPVFDSYEELPLLPLEDEAMLPQVTQQVTQSLDLKAKPEKKEKKLRQKKKNCLLTETPYTDFQTLLRDFTAKYQQTLLANPDSYAAADFKFYHREYVTWATAKQERRADWLHTFYTFLSNDERANKLRLTGASAKPRYPTTLEERHRADAEYRSKAHDFVGSTRNY